MRARWYLQARFLGGTALAGFESQKHGFTKIQRVEKLLPKEASVLGGALAHGRQIGEGLLGVLLLLGLGEQGLLPRVTAQPMKGFLANNFQRPSKGFFANNPGVAVLVHRQREEAIAAKEKIVSYREEQLGGCHVPVQKKLQVEALNALLRVGFNRQAAADKGKHEIAQRRSAKEENKASKCVEAENGQTDGTHHSEGKIT